MLIHGPPMPDAAPTCRLAITVQGIVQGVGFRPFVFQLAAARQLAGWVVNEADAVRIEVEGARVAVESFVQALRTQAPPAARIERLHVQEIPPAAAGPTPFVIRASQTGAARRPTIPADLAVCAQCRQEVMQPDERRHRYPFTNCTNCGPRWSIITGLPYDRPRTSMDQFTMCAACRREYEDPADRRFHAQPIACPDCGPQLRLLRTDGKELQRGDAALDAAAQAVRAGHILALKGLGGFQLVVDATQPAAVERLRGRKHRPDKPLALLVSDLDTVGRICHVSDLERRVLESTEAPILLLERRTGVADAPHIAEAVAPGNPYLGVMLPYTPLHHLLMERVGRPVVCTSGNRAEEPIVVDTRDALIRLGDIADLVLTHNRRIVRPVDDSVAREEAGDLQLLRRARGYAPVPIALGRPLPCVLAVGGHLKNVVALSIGQDV
ncbi:MAG: carbamoyltransferase HypF, partial [Pirellulaceae bacterium]|nr:carbamoyltransferase HypF [Pirellulaceae bacterium]